jgi:hypothetical protein
VVEEAWTDGNVVVDEKVVVVEGEDGLETAIVDEVAMTAEDSIEEVVVIEQIADEAVVGEEA